MEGLLARLQSALSQQPLNLDYLIFRLFSASYLSCEVYTHTLRIIVPSARSVPSNQCHCAPNLVAQKSRHICPPLNGGGHHRSGSSMVWETFSSPGGIGCILVFGGIQGRICG
ncbi:hypothetical protein ILYODFUR_033806 [Ilyodon furcidens]|uniref:Uncharacterized protein n=1 Tax=Ilyodon furcidens TaxID=33524 RepID=A0ABV0VLQ1_9TELE